MSVSLVPDLMKLGLTTLLACAVIAGTALSLYLLLLAAASLRQPPEVGGPRIAPGGSRGSRGASQHESSSNSSFAILIPAHEEELVIGRLLESINGLDY